MTIESDQCGMSLYTFEWSVMRNVYIHAGVCSSGDETKIH
jgi:hypothetical protein